MMPSTALAISANTASWFINVEEESGSGMNRWESEGVDDLMFQQWFWFRDGETGPEQSLDTLGLVSATKPAVNEIFLSYGGPDFLAATVDYELRELSISESIIVENVTVTNTSSSAIDLHWFEYTALDIAGSFTDAGAFPQANGTSIVQTHTDGVTNVDVRVVDGAMPNRWEIAEFADIRNALEDGDPTTLENASFLSGPEDYTHAFEWDLTLNPGGKPFL